MNQEEKHKAAGDHEKREEMLAKHREIAVTHRLSLEPPLRLLSAGIAAGAYGFLTGFFAGASTSSLRYLAENAHRMPRTKGGWYFYHKRKNYVLAKDGMVAGIKKGFKLSTFAMMYFGIEAYLDHARGVIDFGNTVISSGIVGIGYGLTLGLGRRQALKSAKAFLIFGTVTGILQDVMRSMRGNHVWYLDWMKKESSRPIAHQ